MAININGDDQAQDEELFRSGDIVSIGQKEFSLQSISLSGQEVRFVLIDELIARLGYQNKDIRQSAVNALVKIGPSAFQPLTKALSYRSVSIRSFAAVALGQIGDPQAVQSLVKALGYVERSVRGFTAAALGQIGYPQSVKPLIKAL